MARGKPRVPLGRRKLVVGRRYIYGAGKRTNTIAAMTRFGDRDGNHMLTTRNDNDMICYRIQQDQENAKVRVG